MTDEPQAPIVTDGMDIKVRPLVVDDLEEADRIFRLAFGTFLNLPEPEAFAGDADYVSSRWRSPAVAAFGLEVDGKLAGSNFVTRWGSFAFVGPLFIDPKYQDLGLASRLMEPAIEAFERWDCTHEGLFTFAQSPKHLALYRKFGFEPRLLTVIGSFEPATLGEDGREAVLLSEADADDRARYVETIYEISNALLPDLDLSDEITATLDEGLGEVLVLELGDGGRGFAICHEGADTEAGSDTCFVKFAAVRPGPEAAKDFDELLSCIGTFAKGCHCESVVAGTNFGRTGALEIMEKRGFRARISGVEMRRPAEPGWSTVDHYVIDDLR